MAKSRCSLLEGKVFAAGGAGEMGRVLRGWLDGAAPQTATAPDDLSRPFEPSDEVLAGLEWARSFARAVREAGYDDAVRAAIVDHVTKGRTTSARSVRKEEVEAVRTAFKGLKDGGAHHPEDRGGCYWAGAHGRAGRQRRTDGRRVSQLGAVWRLHVRRTTPAYSLRVML